jgi:ABC-2 type transport system permease protein
VVSFRRVAILLSKEAKYGSKNFVFVFAIVMPFVLSVILALLFGTLFAGKPRLGIVDQGESQMVGLAKSTDSVVTTEYDSTEELIAATERGGIDMGVVLPPDFDSSVSAGIPIEITALVWGESLANHRLVLGSLISGLTRDIAGQQAPLDLKVTTLGDAESVPWEDRLLPFIVLMSVVFGGILLPASSLVTEKQDGTLTAVTMTPTTLEDINFSKALLGVVVSATMAALVLIINRAFGSEPFLLMGILFLGAIMASMFGIILGAFAKDVTALFATIKAIGIFLYVPAFVYLFPGMPEWIGRVFPTYYIIAPVVGIIQNDAGWSDVAPDVLILFLLDLILIATVAFVTRKTSQHRVVGQI